MSNFNWPINPTTVNSGPIQFVLDGINTTVEEDSGTPANSVPLPVKIIDPAGLPIDFATATKQDEQTVLLTSIDVAAAAIDSNTLNAVTELVALNASVATEATLATLLTNTQLRASPIDVAVTGAVPLPTGAATEATLLLVETNTSDAVTELAALNAVDFATETTLSSLNGKVVACDTDDVTISQPLPAGNNNIGDVDVASLPVAFNSGNSSATTQRVVIATDQVAIATKDAVNTNGSQTDASLTGTTASTANVPANAVGVIIEAPDTNTNNIRYRIGGTASTTAGMQLQPGRDSGYIPVAANISICAEASGTNAYQVQWILSQ